ncbi:HD-GYP domain-containing protein [Pseudoalteromonas sp. SCSIO 43201]|uniref:HD-GYP domain-containing protein n=1 Tax=Pseudoalteromonas TaxID=53246 RepID=UPI002075ACBE|nr:MULTISPECIES: HD-GYP domain-containing protein [Pseudoalteromonas]MDW7547403.1 HD-GYP domain-containing protein [Pseudoalteromonas peptidolytica]USD27943.1 HD-GYP domain-containing protein [Pseudoalteromonas sp. SCSIO 43201]
MPEINININELEPGMFVVDVTKQTGSVAIKTKGWVKTQTSIDKLQRSGVLEVSVDPSKRLSDHAPHDEPAQDNRIIAPQVCSHDPWHTKCSVEAEMKQAVKLYDEAKAIQSKAFEDIRAGRAIEVDAFKATANHFIDSVFRNQDALACIARIREKDAYLLEHSINVSILMAIFCKHLGYSRSQTEEMTTGALLHDIGKIEVPDEILNKPDKLSLDEYHIMKSHAKYSFDILLNAGLGKIACEIAGYHHERLDGSGYPYGKAADELPQHVRMAAIIDVYDALTAERVYKEGMTPIRAFKLMREGCPHHFDEVLLNRFIGCVGVYPVGTLVKLTSGKVGVIAQSNPNAPLKPTVKVFYHAKYMHYIEVQDIDLNAKKVSDELESAVKPEEFKLDLIRFFRHSMLP